MVCAELPRLAEWTDLSPRERIILTFTALFHDSGKPRTSEIDPVSGRIRSPGHAFVGERIARIVLRELGCELALREEIARMVRYHGRPVFLLEKPDPAREVITLSWHLSNRLLFLFALADTRGRSAGSTARSEETLHFWKLAAEENGCFDRPFPFANDYARVLFYRKPGFNLHFVPHENPRCTVTMLSGLPGSGKDYWLAANRPDLPVVSLDEVRVELEAEPTGNQGKVVQFARERCRELLRAGTSFAFNATNLLAMTRSRWLDLFHDYNARIEIVYLEPPLPVILQQNRREERTVPERVIRELAARCEPPTWAEGHRVTLSDGSSN
jgi:predicted kinase